MDNKGGERIGLLFLHDAGSSGADIASFFSSIPLESFGDKSFQEVCEMLRIQVVTPTALVRSDTDANEEMEVESSLFWEWFAVSPDWRVLGLENTLQEDRHSIDLSKQQLHKVLSDLERRCDYIFMGGLAHGGNMCLELLNENFPGIFQSKPSTQTHQHLSSLQKTYPKVAGIFTIASYLPTSSSVLSHAYEYSSSNESKITSREEKALGKNQAHPLSVLMLHGKDDDTVPCEWGRATAAQLTLHESVDVRFQAFPDTEHEIGENQVQKKGEESLVIGYAPYLHVLLDWIEATVNASKQSAADGIIFKYQDDKKEVVANKDPSSHFHVEALPGTSANTYRITYPAEPDVVHALTGRPVLACGGMFDITEAPNGNGVQCVVHSADPEKTAIAIGERLVARIASHLDGSGNAGEDICSIS